MTVNTLLANLESVQDRRKVLLYVSTGYDLNPFALQRLHRDTRADMYLRDRPVDLAEGAGIPPEMMDPFQRVERQGTVFADTELIGEMAELADAANRTNTTFYTLDPRGLVSSPDIDFDVPLDAWREYMQAARSSLRTLAELTGGFSHRQHEQLRRTAAPDRRRDQRLLRPRVLHQQPRPRPPAARPLGERRPRGPVGAVAHLLHLQPAGGGRRGRGKVTARTTPVVRLALVAAVAALSAPVAAQTPAAVLAEVGAALRGERDLRGVEYRVDGTEVTLSGEVPTLWVKTLAIDRVLEIDGVDAVASELTIPAGEDDDAIARAVGSTIRQYRYNTIWDYIGGRVDDGVVTLNGSVTPERDKPAELFERVAQIPGVQDVVLDIFRQSSSRRDRDLRRIIAERVRRHPVFSQYQLLPDSPFRILVHEGEVLLVGTVRSGVESRVLEQIARQAFESEQVFNRLQVGGG